MKRRASARLQAEKRGRQAERICAWWLRLKGWKILAKRARTPLGEIDLFAHRGSMIAFVEVKSRATVSELDLAIDERRLSRVAAVAEILWRPTCSPATTCE